MEFHCLYLWLLWERKSNIVLCFNLSAAMSRRGDMMDLRIRRHKNRRLSSQVIDVHRLPGAICADVKGKTYK